MRKLISAIVLFWPLLAPADYDAGLAAAARGDFAAALREWRPLAEAGNVDAQNNLGQMYRKGEGVPKDLREAVKWMRMAAEQGHGLAQYNLGVSYAEGRGVPEDLREAAKWFGLAAEQGNAHAQFNLGVMNDSGHAMPEDDGAAVRWFRLAAEQGLASAQYSLGNMYRQGHGVAEDDGEAVKWFRLAAEQGFAEGQNNLGFMYAHGLGVAKNDVQAYRWFANAAAQGDQSARKNLDFVRSRMSAAELAQAQQLIGEQAGSAGLSEAALPAGPQRYVTRANVSYRTGPGTQHQRLGVLRAGKGLQVEAIAGDWLRVRLGDGRMVYVHGDYASPADAPRKRAPEPQDAAAAPPDSHAEHIVTAPLTVRAGPGPQHDPIAWLAVGVAVEVLDASAAWVRIRLDDARTGYVAGAYLAPRR